MIADASGTPIETPGPLPEGYQNIPMGGDTGTRVAQGLRAGDGR